MQKKLVAILAGLMAGLMIFGLVASAVTSIIG